MQVSATTSVFHPANPHGTRVAVVLSGGAYAYQQLVGDMLTGYGRREGYDLLANARRAAYMLTRGPQRGAAGIYEQGERFYVRSMGSFGARNVVQQLHFEGTSPPILAVQDPRLRMLVDGASKLFTTR